MAEIYDVIVTITRAAGYVSDGGGTKVPGSPQTIIAGYPMYKHNYSATRQHLRRLEIGPGVETKEIGFFGSKTTPFPEVREEDTLTIIAAPLNPRLIGLKFKIIGVRPYDDELQIDYERHRYGARTVSEGARS